MHTILPSLIAYLEKCLAGHVVLINQPNKASPSKALTSNVGRANYVYYISIDSLEATANATYKLCYKLYQKMADVQKPNLVTNVFNSGIAGLKTIATVEKLNTLDNSFYCWVFEGYFYGQDTSANYNLDSIGVSFNNQQEETVR